MIWLAVYEKTWGIFHGSSTIFIMQGKPLQFVHNRLFKCSNYEAGKCSVVKHSRLAKIHKNCKNFSFKRFIVYDMSNAIFILTDF